MPSWSESAYARTPLRSPIKASMVVSRNVLSSFSVGRDESGAGTIASAANSAQAFVPPFSVQISLHSFALPHAATGTTSCVVCDTESVVGGRGVGSFTGVGADFGFAAGGVGKVGVAGSGAGTGSGSGATGAATGSVEVGSCNGRGVGSSLPQRDATVKEMTAEVRSTYPGRAESSPSYVPFAKYPSNPASSETRTVTLTLGSALSVWATCGPRGGEMNNPAPSATSAATTTPKRMRLRRKCSERRSIFQYNQYNNETVVCHDVVLPRTVPRPRIAPLLAHVRDRVFHRVVLGLHDVRHQLKRPCGTARIRR